MATSYADQLTSVQTAIANIEAGAQSYSFEGRALSKANLADLYAREKWLRRMVDRAARGGIRVRQGVPVDG